MHGTTADSTASIFLRDLRAQVFSGTLHYSRNSPSDQTPEARYFFVAATTRCISSIVL
jgi:hypothetical protein